MMRIIFLITIFISIKIHATNPVDRVLGLINYKSLGHTRWAFLDVKEDFITYKLDKKIAENGYPLSFSYFFYQAKKNLRHELVVVFPTIIGVSFIETEVAKMFVERGFDVMIPVSLKFDYSYFDDHTVKSIDNESFRPIAQFRFIHLEFQKRFDYQKTFIVGASLGGIRATSLLGRDFGIEKAYTFVAGGDFPEIYSKTKVYPLTRMRQKHMRALGLTDVEEYKQYLQDNLIHDPLHTCFKRKAHLKMVIATQDVDVPTQTQLKLWQACGKPPRRFVYGGHMHGVFMLYLWKEDVLNFFLENSAQSF